MAVTRKKAQTQATPLPVTVGSRKPDPRHVGEMGTKGKNVEGGLDMAKMYFVVSSPAETIGGRATCQSKMGI